MKKKSLYQYIAPNILAMVGMSCYILADTFFIATSQGTNGITALNLALPIYGLIFAIGSMIGTGSAIRYTLAKATDQQEAKKYFSNALIWDAIVSVIFIAAGLFFPGQVMRVMGADAVIEAIGIPYIRIVLCFTPFFMMNYAFTAFVRNDNAPHIAMAATLLSSLFYIVFDYVVDNQDIRNKYRILRSFADRSAGHVIILDMICFEYLILAFDKLVAWTGTGKTDKIKIREEVLSAIENHRINLSKIDDEKTLQYLAGFKRYSTERVMKSLVGEFTQNEKWSVKGQLMGECWYKDCCVSEHTDSLRCGKPEIDDGSEKMRMLIKSEEVQRVIGEGII